MGKNWWRQALGVSNAQRQLSRKLGFPLSGRKSRAGWFIALAFLGVLIGILIRLLLGLSH
jgi:hypothetical protein